MSDKKRVIITIRGGIPEIIEAPDNIGVEIRDYDTEWYDRDDLVEDEDGEKYYLRGG